MSEISPIRVITYILNDYRTHLKLFIDIFIVHVAQETSIIIKDACTPQEGARLFLSKMIKWYL